MLHFSHTHERRYSDRSCQSFELALLKPDNFYITPENEKTGQNVQTIHGGSTHP